MTQRLEEYEALSTKAMNELSEKEKNNTRASKANIRKRAGG